MEPLVYHVYPLVNSVKMPFSVMNVFQEIIGILHLYVYVMMVIMI
jgi:hypothetical protein